MKVKKFRIHPRLGLVGRALRMKMGLKQLSEEFESMIKNESDALFKHITPFATYNTWHGENIPDEVKDILVEAGFKKAVAVSLVTASIGTSPEEILSEVLMEGESTRSQIIALLCEEGAVQSFNFITKLLSDDAKSDDCDISDPVMIENNSEIMVQILKHLDKDNQDIHVDSAAHISPRFTKLALVGWIPASRKKKNTSITKKKQIN